MRPNDLVAYVDVDDTLVRQTGTKRIPMVAVVEHVRQLHRAGVSLFCWSAGGADYSRLTASELGIESLFTGFLPKPHVMLDDQPPSEWPHCIVALPAGFASATVHGHLADLRRAGRRGMAAEQPRSEARDSLPKRLAPSSESTEEIWTDATPPMSLAAALDLAIRRVGRPIADVWSATYISVTQLKRCLSEGALAASSARRFDPHWRIQFAGQEAVIDEGHGSAYSFRLGREDDVLVFADGVVMTHVELTDGSE